MFAFTFVSLVDACFFRANLGSVYSALGNKSEAAAAFKRGLRIAPKDSLLKMNLKALGKEYAITEEEAEEAEEAAAAAARDTGNFGVDSVLATAQASSDEGIIYAQVCWSALVRARSVAINL